MKTFVITLSVIISLSILTTAQYNAVPEEWNKLQQTHQELIKKYGHIQFLEGQNCFKPIMNTVFSVYRLKTKVSVCGRVRGRLIYCIVEYNKTGNGFKINWIWKFNSKNTVKTLAYSVEVIRENYSIQFNMAINKELTDLDDKLAASCLLNCTNGVYECYSCVYECIKNCDEDITYFGCIFGCISPCLNIWKCIEIYLEE